MMMIVMVAMTVVIAVRDGSADGDEDGGSGDEDDGGDGGCEDGGDCCGDGISILLCTACECLDPEEQGGGRISIVENIVEFVNVTMKATLNSTIKGFKMFSFFHLNYYLLLLMPKT